MNNIVIISGPSTGDATDPGGLTELLNSRAAAGLPLGGLSAEQVPRAVNAVARGRTTLRLEGLSDQDADALMDQAEAWGFQVELVLNAPGSVPTDHVEAPSTATSAPAPPLPGHGLIMRSPPRKANEAPKTPVRRAASSAVSPTPQPAPTGSAAIVCPHCQVQGKVVTSLVKVKKGISGAKATGALLTGGISLLGTGLSKKGYVTRALCHNCQVSWIIDQ